MSGITVYYIHPTSPKPPKTYALQNDASFLFHSNGLVTDLKNNNYTVGSIVIDSTSAAGHVKFTPDPAGAPALQLDYIRIADAAGAQISHLPGAYVQRVILGGNIVRYEFGPPGGPPGSEVTWDFDTGTPPLALAVRIKRV